MLLYAEAAEKYKAVNHIINERNQHFLLAPFCQEWLDRKVSQRTIEAGCKRFAAIKNDNFFEQIALEQIFDEEVTNRYSSKCLIRFRKLKSR